MQFIFHGQCVEAADHIIVIRQFLGNVDQNFQLHTVIDQVHYPIAQFQGVFPGN
jgi:hypothetical protein